MSVPQSNVNLKSRLHYKFDKLMSSGTLALILSLWIISVLIIFAGGFIIFIFNFAQLNTDSPDLIEAVWLSLVRTLDPGTMGQDSGWGFRIVMLLVTIGGIFIVSTLIGVLSSGIQEKINNLRKGKSLVLESNHTLILGWSPKIFTIISELLIANENQKSPSIVILSEREKPDMEDDLKVHIPRTKNTKIICRTGNPLDFNDLKIVNPQNAKSIIIVSPDNEDADVSVIKTILSISKYYPEAPKVIAEIIDDNNMSIAEMIGKENVSLIPTKNIISKLIAQTCRQCGLSTVYTELFDFDGSEIYFYEEPALTGKTFKESLFEYEVSSVIGVKTNTGEILINPSMDLVYRKGDKVIAISEDDDTIVLSDKKYKIEKNAISGNTAKTQQPEKTLILGWNNSAPSIIKELDSYFSKGSEITVAYDSFVNNAVDFTSKLLLNNSSVNHIAGDLYNREFLISLGLEKYNHIILLCYSDYFDNEKSDARALMTLLQLRDIASKLNLNFNIVSEIMNIQDKELAEGNEVHDFVVSDQLISLILTQISENPDLKVVFENILNPEGSEIYLKPAEDYIVLGKDVNFYTVLEAASAKNEIAIGYKSNKFSNNGFFGIKVNPNKSEMISFEKEDRIIVFAES